MSSLDKLQEAYKQLLDKKGQRKEIMQSFKDELNNTARYREIVEKMTELREEKKQLENEVYARSMADIQKVEDLKQDIKTHEMLVSDIAVNLMMQNESVEVVDEYNNKYEAQFVARFKKTGDVAKEQAAVAEMAEEMNVAPNMEPGLAAA
ncbi:MAG: hypothetical protein WCJ29_03670 [bacterium]